MSLSRPFIVALCAVAVAGCFGSSFQGLDGSGGDGDSTAQTGGAAGDGSAGSGALAGIGGASEFPGTGGDGMSRPGGGFGFAGAGAGIGFPGGMVGVGGIGSVVDLGECRDDGGFYDANYCERQLQCDNGYAHIFCEDQGDVGWCNCDQPYGTVQYVIGGGIDQACMRIEDVCTGAAMPQPVAPATCATSYTDAGRDFCSTEVECRQQLQTSDGLDLELNEWRSSYCSLGAGGWLCECYDGNSNMRLELPADANAPGVCETVIDACGDDSIVLSGVPECSPRSLYTDSNYCNVEIECARSARLGDLDVRVFQPKWANCEFLGGKTWSCFCGENGPVSGFEIEADSGWETCTAAGEVCTEG